MRTKRVFLAAMLAAACSLAFAGEEPGLEVFDVGTRQPAPAFDYQPAPSPVIISPILGVEAQPLPPVVVPDSGTYIDPYDQPMTATTVLPRQPVPDPVTDPFAPVDQLYQPAYEGEADPFTDPYAGSDETVAAPVRDAPVIATNTVVADAPPVFESFYPADPVQATLDDLNIRNSAYPGLAEAAATRDINAVGSAVLQALRSRRVLEATLERGPGASAGYANPYEMQRILQIVQYTSAPGEDSPLLAAGRVNALIDAFSMPVIEDAAFGSIMGQFLVRLHDDIVAIHNWLDVSPDNTTYLELVRTYIRAATSCDFFIFSRSGFATDVNTMYDRSGSLFYPDGASIAGDVGGVTGNLLGSLVMLQNYTRNDSRYRRDMRRAWLSMERPARYALNLALPDMTMPRIGPRGMREMTIEQVMRLNEIFPKQPQRRLGLAASQSFPSSSDQRSYGGIFATRSGYDTTGRYLAVRFGPLGIMPGVPAHRDFGTVELMSRGVRFLVDGGGFGGAATVPAAHSGLSLDGQYVLDTTYNTPGQPVGTIWRTNAGMDYASDMASFADGKTWQRTLVYVKDLPGEALSDYWVVLDHVGMNNDNQPHQARIRYQFAPGIQAYHDGSGIVATVNYAEGSALRLFAIDGNTELTVTEGDMGLVPSFVHDSLGGQMAAPSVQLNRTLVGDTTTATLIYPAENMNHRPARIERDSDLIRGRTGAIVIDHGHGRIDVIAWAPPGTELVTPTLNLQMSADLGIFRLRNGSLSRVSFVNLENFQAKEPNGGIWSMRVNGPAQTLTLEPQAGGGWHILSDPANQGGATLHNVNFGPGVARNRIAIRPGELRIISR